MAKVYGVESFGATLAAREMLKGAKLAKGEWAIDSQLAAGLMTRVEYMGLKDSMPKCSMLVVGIVGDDIDNVPDVELPNTLYRSDWERMEAPGGGTMMSRKYFLELDALPIEDHDNYSLRPVVSQDTDFIHELYNAPEVYPNIAGGKPMARRTAENLTSHGDYPRGCLTGFMSMMVMKDDEPIGHVLVRMDDWRGKIQRIWERRIPGGCRVPKFAVLRIAISPGHQRTGTAGKVLPALLKYYNQVYPYYPIYMSAFLDDAWGKSLERGYIKGTKLIGKDDNPTEGRRPMVLVGHIPEAHSYGNTPLPPPREMNSNTLMHNLNDIADYFAVDCKGTLPFLAIIENREIHVITSVTKLKPDDYKSEYKEIISMLMGDRKKSGYAILNKCKGARVSALDAENPFHKTAVEYLSLAVF